MLKLNRLLTLLACFVLVTSFMGCAATQKHESTGEYVDNTAVTTKVKTAIFNEESLKTMQINVKTFKGEVQLSGFVDSAMMVKKAGEVARGVEGVDSVRNDLIVK